MKTAYRPTKRCPHRWCPTAHSTAAILFYVPVLFPPYPSPWFLLIMLIPLVPISIAYTKFWMSHDPEFVAPVRLSKNINTVDPSRARLAFAADILAVGYFAYQFVRVLQHIGEPSPSLAHSLQRMTAMWQPILAFAVWEWLHWRASRTRRPKRVRSTVPVEVSS